MNQFIPLSVSSPLPVSTSSLSDVLQTIVALQSCPTTSVPSTSTAIFSTNLPFPTATIPSVNLFPPAQPVNPIGIATMPVQPFLASPSLLSSTPSAVEVLANALFATTSRRASCPEPPASSQTTGVVTLQIPPSGSPERRRYSETSMEALIREQLAQIMPSTAQLPGMPGCYYQHGPAVPSAAPVGVLHTAGPSRETAAVATASAGVDVTTPVAISGAAGGAHFVNSMAVSRRATNHRKARTIYGTTQTQQLENMFRDQMYVVGAEREHLANSLGLSPSQVRIWFQNRRSKHRRKQLEERTCSTEKEQTLEEKDDEEDEDDV